LFGAPPNPGDLFVSLQKSSYKNLRIAWQTLLEWDALVFPSCCFRAPQFLCFVRHFAGHGGLNILEGELS
jgi:hypothetical protein